MPKRPFSEIVDDLAMDVLSAVVKHAKTVDYEPLLKAAPLLLTLTGAHPGVVDRAATADNEDVYRFLDKFQQKMLTSDKDGSNIIYTHAAAPPEACCPTASTADSDGEKIAPCGFCGTATCCYSGGTGSDQDDRWPKTRSRTQQRSSFRREWGNWLAIRTSKKDLKQRLKNRWLFLNY